ncbi:MAG TPA: TRAP transporter small permease [Spirochaetia bacterium]|nr:TRAP transporter small permease [Spirochaetia bacterium]
MVVRNFFRIVDALTNSMVYLLLSVMVLNTAVSVFFRYILGNAISWSEEVSRYLMIWMGFFGMSLATRDREHVGVTFFINALPPIPRKILRYLSDFLVIGFLLLLIVLSISQIIGSEGETTAALEIPMAIPLSSVTVGGFLMFLQAIRRTVKMIREDLKPQQE